MHPARERGRLMHPSYIMPCRLQNTYTLMTAAFAWTGFASTFLEAGFSECARRLETRPVMRLILSD